MELHWSKFQLVSVGQQYRLHTPGGDEIPAAEVMNYLGAHLYADGCVRSELHRKIGQAWGDFSILNSFWKHAALTRKRKLEVFDSVVVSRLLYGLSSAWLNAADIRRLNGFHCRCLRVILGIQPSFVSRISNQKVLREAGKPPLANVL